MLARYILYMVLVRFTQLHTFRAIRIYPGKRLCNILKAVERYQILERRRIDELVFLYFC